MRAHWDTVIADERRIPNGAELARIGGCDPSWGRKLRAQWEAEMDGRTRRALTKRSTA
jgi:hypothetical protein